MSWVETAIVVLYSALLVVLSTYGAHRLVIAALYLRHRDRAPAPGPAVTPRVTVQLPVYNERNVIERLIDAAARLDWPSDRLEIQVLDDSTDDTAELAAAAVQRWRAAGRDIRWIHRTDRAGFKAGALEAGLATAKGDWIAIFDADFVPQPDFLRQVAPYLGAPEVAMVQARWGHLNDEVNLLTRLSCVLLDGHFVLEHTARNRAGRWFNFNGTAGLWRREAIAEAGGWQHDTVTEDLDLSYRAQLAGRRFVYLKDLVVPSEIPSSMRAFKNQQHRWAKGSMQTARKLLGRVLRAPVPGYVKREAFVHLTNNLAYPLVLLMAVLLPLAVAARGRGGWERLLLLDLPAFLAATLSIAAFYALALRESTPDWRARLWRVPGVMALGVGMAVNQTGAVFEGLLGRDATFVRTPKRGEVGRRASVARHYAAKAGWAPVGELALAAWLGAGLVWAAREGHYGSLPFLALFFSGFLYVGLASLWPERAPTGAAAPSATSRPARRAEAAPRPAPPPLPSR